MKYYSQITKKLYDTQDELTKAEIEAVKAKSDRAERAKEVENALKAANDASKKANDLLSAFVRDYGSFKTTIKDEDAGKTNFWSVFEKLF